MIWLSWRQFRGQAIAALGALGALAIYLVILGLSLRHAYHSDVAGCAAGAGCNAAEIHLHDAYETRLTLLSILLIAVPALTGAFWGAPLLTRELEAATHRLVWTQSVTRRAWLAARLGVVGVASVAVCGLLSLLLTWAAHPYDQTQSHFAALSFDARDVVPLAYAAFAFALGLTAGLVVKRTLPAMAITLALFAAVQLVMAQDVRPHLMAPVRSDLTFDARTIGSRPLHFDTAGDGSTSYIGYARPGAWIISNSPLMTADGRPADLGGCFADNASPATLLSCIAKRHVHWVTTYQPADRYWTFQAIELAIFLGLAGVLAGFCLWRISHTTA